MRGNHSARASVHHGPFFRFRPQTTGPVAVGEDDQVVVTSTTAPRGQGLEMNVAVTWLSKGLGVAKAVAEQVMKGPVPEPVPVEPVDPKPKKAKSRGVRASKTKFPQQAEYVEAVYHTVVDMLNGDMSGELKLRQIRGRLPKADWRIPHAALCQLICAGRMKWRGTRFTVLTPIAA